MTLPRALQPCAICTPAELADAIARTLRPCPSDIWLDPCVGDGAFLRALGNLGVTPDRIIAVDLDKTPSPQDVLASTKRGIDFIAWARETTRRFDKIVANPPYIPISKLGECLQKVALTVKSPNDQALGLRSNYWTAFLSAGLNLLRLNGDICFILPAAWDFATYAASLRESLPQLFSKFHVHRCREVLFREARDGCIVIIGHGFGRPNHESLRFEHDSSKALTRALLGDFTAETSRKEIKTTAQLVALRRGICRLGDVLDVRLGGVTGDVQYFLLTEEQRREWGFPMKCLRPVLSKAHHLIAGEIRHRHWERLRKKGRERVWLFDPPPRFLRHPAIRTYLRLATLSGGCRRDAHKIKTRKPWYRIPMERKIDGFISGMSRFGPWIALREMPRLTATNTLYIVRFLQARTLDEKAAWGLSLLTSRTRELMNSFGRRYADGLLKYEPGDIRAIPVTIPRKVRGARAVYIKAVEALLSGEEMKCHKIADDWFQEPHSESATERARNIGAGALKPLPTCVARSPRE